MTSQDKLMPCPFCGSAPVAEPRRGSLSASVACRNKACGIQPESLSADMAYAKARWNARPPTDGLVAGVVEHVRDLNYLEQAEAHADEGPLGNPAAVAILKLALKYARAHNAMERRNAELEGALAPFAKIALHCAYEADDVVLYTHQGVMGDYPLTIGDFRQARKALSHSSETGK